MHSQFTDTESISSLARLIDDLHYLFHESNPHLGECVQIHSIVGDSAHAPAYILRSIFNSYYMFSFNEFNLSYHVEVFSKPLLLKALAKALEKMVFFPDETFNYRQAITGLANWC